MEKILNLTKSPYFFIFVLAIVNLMIAFIFLPHPLKLNSDAPSYLAAMQFLQDKEYDTDSYGADTEVIIRSRILTTPLMLNASIFLGKIVGSEYGGMFLINIIFYFLIIFVFYKLVYLIYKSHQVSFLASILFFVNYCMYNYGTTYRTDMGGWFFFLLATLFAIKYYQSQAQDKKYFFYAILAAAIGVLFKEYSALGMISLGMLILLLPENFWSKVKKIFWAAILFLIIPVFYHLFIYLKLGFSYIDWYEHAFQGAINNPEAIGIDWSIILLIKVLGWLFLIGWPIFVWGLYQEYKNFDKTRTKILLALLPASLAFLAWPVLTQRIAFIFVPWLALIAGFGLGKIKSKYFIAIILIVYALVNYLTRPFLLSWINL